MGFWLMFFVSLAFDIVGELLRPKQKIDSQKPSAIGDFSFPTADATRSIPFFLGTCKLAGPNTTWYGDLSIVAIVKHVKTGIFSSTSVNEGFKYYLGVQLVFGFGYLDELLDVRFDDKDTKYTVTATTADMYSVTVDDPTLTSADDPKDGVKGILRLYRGTFNQPADTYFNAQVGESDGPSAYRPLIHAVLEHMYLGNSSTPPPMGIVGRCTPNTLALTGGKNNVDGDCNIAQACYTLMTDQLVGMKISPSLIDDDSFRACGNVLFDEGLGVSMLFDTQQKAKDNLDSILQHADGVIYPDPVTGLYTMALARADYDVDDLPVFDESNIEPGSFQYSRVSWDQTVNTTIVNYTDRAQGFTQQPVTYQDLGNITVRNGAVVSESVDFLGFSKPAQALLAAARSNKTRSSPLLSVTFNTNRAGYILRPSSVLKLVYPAKGLDLVLLRVVNISYGTIDDPRVKVTCAEDVFNVTDIAYSAPSPSDWVPLIGDPVAINNQALIEAPRFLLASDERRVLTLATPAGAYTLGYNVWSDPTGGTAYAQSFSTSAFTPLGELSANYNVTRAYEDATGFTVNGITDVSALATITSAQRAAGENLVLLGNEILAWDTFTDLGGGSYRFGGVWSGVLDTVPEQHNAGALVWFITQGMGTVREDPYAADVTVNAKLQPFTSKGELDISTATNMAITTASRYLRPVVQGKVRINATRPVDISTTLSGALAISWAYRNRLDALVHSQEEATIAPSSTLVSRLRFYDDGTNTLLIQKTDIGTIATAASASLAFTGNVRMELETFDNGLASWQMQVARFAYNGTGIVTSSITADAAVYILDGGGA